VCRRSTICSPVTVFNPCAAISTAGICEGGHSEDLTPSVSDGFYCSDSQAFLRDWWRNSWARPRRTGRSYCAASAKCHCVDIIHDVKGKVEKPPSLPGLLILLVIDPSVDPADGAGLLVLQTNLEGPPLVSRAASRCVAATARLPPHGLSVTVPLRYECALDDELIPVSLPVPWAPANCPVPR
jgi:hypothetical protein